jgi:hypothetical protein
VIPRFLYEWEVGHDGLTELEIVETLTERKVRMGDLSDAFLSLPGGIGTMDELFEALSWAQLGLETKPNGLLNVNGYYDGLIAFLDRATAEGFVREHRALLASGRIDDADALCRPVRGSPSSPPGLTLRGFDRGLERSITSARVLQRVLLPREARGDAAQHGPAPALQHLAEVVEVALDGLHVGIAAAAHHFVVAVGAAEFAVEARAHRLRDELGSLGGGEPQP